MKSPTIHTLRLVFSLFLLVLILLMLGYALYNLAGGFSRGPQGEGVVISDVPVEVVTSIVGASVIQWAGGFGGICKWRRPSTGQQPG